MVCVAVCNIANVAPMRNTYILVYRYILSHYQQNPVESSDALCDYCSHRVTEHNIIIESAQMQSSFTACMVDTCRMSEDPCQMYMQDNGRTDGICTTCWHPSGDHKCIRILSDNRVVAKSSNTARSSVCNLSTAICNQIKYKIICLI